MNYSQTVGVAFQDAFGQTVAYIVSILPIVLAAILILVVGWLVADWLGKLVRRVLEKVYVDQALEKLGVTKTLQSVGFRLSVSRALGWLVTWFLYAVVLVSTANLLGLEDISRFLNAVVLYIPNVIIAVVVMVVGIVVGSFVETLVIETTRAANIAAGPTLARLSKWTIVVFALLAALVQLNVAEELITILFTGFVAMLALAGGIAFGLGGKDKAKEVIDSLTRR
jgi:hypothetical protein